MSRNRTVRPARPTSRCARQAGRTWSRGSPFSPDAVKAGQTLRYRIEVAPAPSTVGSLALVSNVPVVSGKVTSAKGVLLEGQVVIYREVQKLPLEKGRFSLAGASKGRYRIEYYDKSGSKRATKDVVVSDGGATVTIQAP